MRTINASVTKKMIRSRKNRSHTGSTLETSSKTHSLPSMKYELLFQKSSSSDAFDFSSEEKKQQQSPQYSHALRIELNQGENEFHILWKKLLEAELDHLLKDRLPVLEPGIYLDIDGNLLVLKDCRKMNKDKNDCVLYVHCNKRDGGEGQGGDEDVPDLIWEKVSNRQARVLKSNDAILLRWDCTNLKESVEYRCQFICTNHSTLEIEDKSSESKLKTVNEEDDEETETEVETLVVKIDTEDILRKGHDDIIEDTSNSNNKTPSINDNQGIFETHSVIDVEDESDIDFEETQIFTVEGDESSISTTDEKESQALSLDLLPTNCSKENDNKTEKENSIQEILINTLEETKQEEVCSSSSSTTASLEELGIQEDSLGTTITDKFFTASSILTSSPVKKDAIPDINLSPILKEEKTTITTPEITPTVSNMLKKNSSSSQGTHNEQIVESKGETSSETCKASSALPEPAKDEEKKVDANATPPSSNVRNLKDTKATPKKQSAKTTKCQVNVAASRSTRRKTAATNNTKDQTEQDTQDTFEFKSEKQTDIQVLATPTRSCKRKYGCKNSPSSNESSSIQTDQQNKSSEKKISPPVKRPRRAKAIMNKIKIEEENAKLEDRNETPENKIIPTRPKSKRGRKSSTPKKKTDEDTVDATEAPKRGRKVTPKKKSIKTDSTDATSKKATVKRRKAATRTPTIKSEEKSESTSKNSTGKRGRKTRTPTIKTEETSDSTSTAATLPIRILITGVTPTSKMKKVVSSFPNASIINNLSQAKHATHVIASLDKSTSLRRTPKLMIGLCVTKHILYSTWLSSEDQKSNDHLIRDDEKAQDKYNFRFVDTHANFQYVHSQRSGLLSNFKIYFSKHLSFDKIPSLKELQYIVESADGTVIKKLTTCKIDGENKILIFVNEAISKREITQIEDFGYTQKEHCRSISWLFQCIMNQKLNGIDKF